MPKKVLVAAAHALDEIERAKAHHITVGNPSLDWAALIDREKAMIAGIPASLGALMERRGVEVIRDRGRFASPNAIAVGGETLEARHIVVATGSTPRKLPFPGSELMIISDDVLSERRLPASVVFVGGGVIALEFSHVYARCGAKVTILEVLPRLLDNVDADAVAQLRTATERIGVAIHTGVEIQRIERMGERLRVVYQEGGPSTRSRPSVSSTAPGESPMSTASTLPPAMSRRSAGESRMTRICARRRTPLFMFAVTRSPGTPSSHRSRPMRAGSSAAILSTARSTRPITRASRPVSSPCRRWRASA
jgi:glutathione reductase (NADPH)